MEAIVGTLIATLAVVGLAYSFGLGRGYIDRFEVARVADGVAQARMEYLGIQAADSPDLALGSHPGTPIPFVIDGTVMGAERWSVTIPSSTIPGFGSLRRVTVNVSFRTGASFDSVSYDRLVAAP